MGCSTGGLGAQPLCDMVLIPASFLQLQLFNRGPSGPLCWVLVFSTASYFQLPDFLSSPGLYNFSTPTFLWASQIALNSTHPRSRLYPDIPRPDAPVIYTGAFPVLTTWPGSICYNLNLCHQLNWSFMHSYYRIREVI